ncbi:uncharacterized protein LOC122246610 isoform X2 [Penaeus japonicus]|uniref:uncharacterized protein LOC122246610 isoform X2 n=1 Tax=Penaeus japonicus TaxID=27405 RepID=UPI001C70FBC6|nr:uncharacterized protein LOC122246610 isoform X2 [Penaeus japonicus]
MTAITMRILFINICVVLVAVVTIRAQTSQENEVVSETTDNKKKDLPFLETDSGKKILDLMNKHLQNSLDYLYTSKQYDSQYLGRPGMAKYLQKMSDDEWEEGLDTLKKFLQRGGKVEDFRDKVNVDAKGQLDFSDDENKYSKYVETFGNIHKDSAHKFMLMNRIISKASKHKRFEAEICHYLEESLTKEAERMYELKTHETIAKGLESVGVGLSLFDASL